MVSRRSLLTGAAALLATGASGVALARTLAGQEPFDPAIHASRVAWLAKNAAPLRSIDVADNDFSDLESFRKAVGDARVVMLGEQSHGDGTTMAAKARLVRFLHEQMDFDVLAFESNVYNMRKAWERMQAGESPRTAATRGMMGMWSHSKQVRPLIDYIGERTRADRPLELAGFDCQLFAPAVADNLTDDLASFLSAHGVDIVSVTDLPVLRATIGKLVVAQQVSEAERDAVTAAIDSVTRHLATIEVADAAFWRQVLKSTKACAQMMAINPTGWENFARMFNLRDEAMADNLIWLVRHRYPQRKIIVWAATYHLYHLPDGKSSSDGRKNMGTFVSESLGEAAYNVAFTCYAGRRNFVSEDRREIAPAPADSLEGLWAATGQQYGFLDLRHPPAGGEWLREPFASRVLAEGSEAPVAPWSALVDSVLLLRTMEPNQYDASASSE